MPSLTLPIRLMQCALQNQLPQFRYFPIFTSKQTFVVEYRIIFNEWRRSSALSNVKMIKKKKTSIFAYSSISLTKKLANKALVTPTTGLISPPIEQCIIELCECYIGTNKNVCI